MGVLWENGRILGVCGLLALGGCMAAGGGERPKGDTTSLEELSVGTGARGGDCSTAIVRGLVEQIVAETNCLRPGALERIDTIPGVTLAPGAASAPYLQADAAAALRRAVEGRTIQISAGLETLPQQYLRGQWEARGRCGVRDDAEASGEAHQSGAAIDVEDNERWRSPLGLEGFRWSGEGRPPHFDFPAGSDLGAASVEAFQRLWNRNHPEDPLPEDGTYGPAVEDRLRRSPGEGFATGARCDTPPPPTDPPDAGAPPDAGTPSDGGTTPDAGTPPPPPPPPASPCDAGHGGSCESCNALAVECGWCGATGRCIEGDEFGPLAEGCAGGWEWVAPSQCGLPPSDPYGGDPYGGDPYGGSPMCLARASACSPGQCCAGLECRSGVTFGVQCCGAAGAACAGGGDCCGYMDCVAGYCQARVAGRACIDSRDCLSGYCSAGVCG